MVVPRNTALQAKTSRMMAIGGAVLAVLLLLAMSAAMLGSPALLFWLLGALPAMITFGPLILFSLAWVWHVVSPLAERQRDSMSSEGFQE